MTVTGVVDLAGGGQARLHATARIVVRRDGTLVLHDEPVQLFPL